MLASDSMTALSDPNDWVERHGSLLFSFALTRVRDRATAEDLVQETLLAALRSRGNFQGRSSESTWMVGILKNKIMDHFRKTSREVDHPLPFENEQLYETTSDWSPVKVYGTSGPFQT
jgi:RNA polymerase sigma-70 factor (ECF subfamily)